MGKYHFLLLAFVCLLYAQHGAAQPFQTITRPLADPEKDGLATAIFSFANNVTFKIIAPVSDCVATATATVTLSHPGSLNQDDFVGMDFRFITPSPAVAQNENLNLHFAARSVEYQVTGVFSYTP